MDKFYKFKSKPFNLKIPVLRRTAHEYCVICGETTCRYGIIKCYKCVRPGDNCYQNYCNDPDAWWAGRVWNKDRIILKAQYLQNKRNLSKFLPKEILAIVLTYLHDFGSDQTMNIYNDKIPKISPHSISHVPYRLITTNENCVNLLKWQIWKNQRNKFKQKIIKVLHNFSESNSNINSNIIEFLFEKDVLDKFFYYED